MNDNNPSAQISWPCRAAWNKGKLTGPKPPLRPGHVWSIRAKLQLERRTRETWQGSTLRSTASCVGAISWSSVWTM